MIEFLDEFMMVRRAAPERLNDGFFDASNRPIKV